MKNLMTDRAKPAPAAVPIEELTPQPYSAAARRAHKIVLAIAGKRYEFTIHTEVREITKGPAKLIGMPGHPSVKP